MKTGLPCGAGASAPPPGFRPASSNPRSGYALLFIYLMAATLAIMLYMQLPKAAFEAQRDREQLLIDRGEQYKRAVQLYVRKFNRFPADINALENTQNIRFLRKQYVDPMTGKNEWRLIHVGPGGAFIDSQINGNNKPGGTANAPQTFIAEVQQVGGNQSNPNQGVNQALRRRPSDDPGGPGASPGDPNNPGNSTATGPVMVLPDGRIVPATPTGIPASTNNSGTGSAPGQPGQPIQPGQVPPGGFQNNPNTASNGPAPGGNAASLINQILTTPRPGGLNGTGGYQPAPDGSQANAGASGVSGGASIFGTQTGNNTGTPLGQNLGGSTVGGGIAGVASKFEEEGIKVYNDQTSYNKWEFVYDMSKDASRTGATPQTQQPANPALQPGNQPSNQSPQSPSPSPATPPNPVTGTGN